MNILLSISLFISISFSQKIKESVNTVEYKENGTTVKIDTVKHWQTEGHAIVAGTGWIPNLYNNRYGLYPKDFVVDQCHKKSVENFKTGITDVYNSDSVLTIKANIIVNCCGDALYDFDIIEGDSLQISQIEYGGRGCGCYCGKSTKFEFDVNPSTDEPERRISNIKKYEITNASLRGTIVYKKKARIKK